MATTVQLFEDVTKAGVVPPTSAPDSSVATSSNANSLSSDAICVSAPGKVLMAGGYLVLDRQYEGLVLATSSRFYCVASSSSAPAVSTPDAKSARITISASQFPVECSWSYDLTVPSNPSDGLFELEMTQTNPQVGRNKFVEITLAKALQLALETIGAEGKSARDVEAAGTELLRRIRGKGGAMQAFVMADNDFYSQREQVGLFFSAEQEDLR